MTKYAIGLDLGGTNFRAAAIDEKGSVLDKIAGPSNSAGGLTAILDTLVRAILTLRERRAGDELVGTGVALAGFMRVLSPWFVRRWSGRLVNIHPALLPSFPGLHVQRAALEHGARFSGCTVHFVDAGVDTGPIIIQAAVPVLDGDTEETLAARILRQEHRIYPQAIHWFARGRLSLRGRAVQVDGARLPAPAALLNPLPD